MNIISLEAENIKRLKAIRIEPDGALVVIGGKNAQGKTSVLDSIQFALGGKDSVPIQPIRKGEKRAVVSIDLGEFVVKRIFTEKDSRLEVTAKDGFLLRSPQSLLDNLTGKPLTLKNLVGLDFSELDRQREETFNNRTIINREIKAIEARIKAIPLQQAPKEEASISNLTKELEDRMKVNQVNTAKRSDLKHVAETIERVKEEIKTMREEIERLQRKLNLQLEGLDSLEGKYANLKKEVNALIDTDIDSIKAEISEAEKINENVRSNRQRFGLEQELRTKAAEGIALNKKIDEIDKDKEELLSLTEFPVDGLGFDENGVIYKGIPFEQCSSSEQLRVSVAIGLAMNPKLKVLLIRDGSLLDEKNLALIAQMSEEADAQVWLERVGEGKEVSVIIEDGSIK